MTPSELVKFALALWVITHVFAVEIPKPSQVDRKPFTCQLCLSGWVCIILAGAALFKVVSAPIDSLNWLTVWAIAVLIEKVYERLSVHVF